MLNKLYKEEASGLLEFALILPLLVLMVIGVFDIGRGYTTYITLGNGAREGARWLTTHGKDDNVLDMTRTHILSEASQVDLINDEITITPSKAIYNAGDEVTILIDHPYPLLFGTVTGLPTPQMRIEATMTVLY